MSKKLDPVYVTLASNLDQEWAAAMEWADAQVGHNPEALKEFLAVVSPKYRNPKKLIRMMSERPRLAAVVCRLCFVGVGESVQRLKAAHDMEQEVE